MNITYEVLQSWPEFKFLAGFEERNAAIQYKEFMETTYHSKCLIVEAHKDY